MPWSLVVIADDVIERFCGDNINCTHDIIISHDIFFVNYFIDNSVDCGKKMLSSKSHFGIEF